MLLVGRNCSISMSKRIVSDAVEIFGKYLLAMDDDNNNNSNNNNLQQQQATR